MTAEAAVARASALFDANDDPAIVIQRTPSALLRAQTEAIDQTDADSVPLRGTTFAVKDNIDVAGTRTTAACPQLDASSGGSAPVVERLTAAGAVAVAKVNMDQFATGLVGTRSPYGIPRNPFDPELVPGGSSSGSAVAVARGLVSFALGTDTAGSGRVPAAMCGLVGFKPTRGWLSTRGVVPAVRSIDCVSVFAPTVDTAWQAVQAAGGFDPLDPMSRHRQIASRGVARRAAVLGAASLSTLGVTDEVMAGYAAACRALEGAGVELIEIDPTPLIEIGDLLYGGPFVAERFTAIGAFMEGDIDGIDPVVREIVTGSTHWSLSDAHRATYQLGLLRHVVDALFSDIDVLVTPTVPFLPSLADVAADPRGLNERLGRFTTFTNLCDLCALAVPFGSPADGRPPANITFHAPAWSDELLVNTAALVIPGATSVVPDGWIKLAVAGAHLKGFPLEWQLTQRSAVWLGTTTTAPEYRLYALSGTVPPKPGLFLARDGAEIEVDLWALSPAAFGSFVAAVPAPLCIGTVGLSDGSRTSGFLCEAAALDSAADITEFGGWRAFSAAR